MSIAGSYTGNLLFPSGVQTDVTSGLGSLWDNVRLLDILSLRGREIFQDNAYRYDSGGANGGTNGDNPLRSWDGGFKYRTGLTTLTIVLSNSLSGSSLSEVVRVYCDDTLIASPAATAGTQTITISTLASQGWADGQVIRVRIQLYTAAYPVPPDINSPVPWGTYKLLDAYVSPLSGIDVGTWGGVPTFTTSPTAAKMAQLVAAADWLAQRINLQPVNLFQSISRASGLYFLDDDGVTTIPQPQFQASFVRGNNDRLTIYGIYQIVKNPAETITTYLNGSLVATLGPYAAPASGSMTQTFNISAYSSSSPVYVEIFTTCTSELSEERERRPSRFTIYAADVHRNNPGYATMPSRWTPEESLTWLTNKTRLNDLSTLLGTIYTRITGDTEWNRARLFRSNYGYDEDQKLYYAMRYRPYRIARAGRRLVVRGKDVKIGWGGVSSELTDKTALGIDGETNYSYEFTETLISGDKESTVSVGLDTLDGLDVGTAYTLMGSTIYYAAEELL